MLSEEDINIKKKKKNPDMRESDFQKKKSETHP